MKSTKKLSDGTQFHYLTWEGEEGGGKWLTDDFFKLADGDDEAAFNLDQDVLHCGTRKSRDKRICR